MRHTGMTHHRGAGSPGSGNTGNCSLEDFAMNRIDFTPYRRSMVGFDRLFDMIES